MVVEDQVIVINFLNWIMTLSGSIACLVFPLESIFQILFMKCRPYEANLWLFVIPL